MHVIRSSDPQKRTREWNGKATIPFSSLHCTPSPYDATLGFLRLQAPHPAMQKALPASHPPLCSPLLASFLSLCKGPKWSSSSSRRWRSRLRRQAWRTEKTKGWRRRAGASRSIWWRWWWRMGRWGSWRTWRSSSALGTAWRLLSSLIWCAGSTGSFAVTSSPAVENMRCTMKPCDRISAHILVFLALHSWSARKVYSSRVLRDGRQYVHGLLFHARIKDMYTKITLFLFSRFYAFERLHLLQRSRNWSLIQIINIKGHFEMIWYSFYQT